MSSFLKRVTVIILLLLAAACSGDDPQSYPSSVPFEPTMPSGPDSAGPEEESGGDAALNEPFTLAVAESAVVETAGFTITFDRVVGDSRCPSAVTCVQNGPVIVQISAELDDSSANFEMNPSPQLGALQGIPPNIVTFAEYEIELTAVDPYPVQPEDLMNMDYTATLIVRRPGGTEE